MARTSVTTQEISRTGLTPVLTAPIADGDVIDCGRVFLYVLNGGASPISVTVQTPLTVDGLGVDDVVVSVAAGAEKFIGPFPASVFGRPFGSADVGRAYVDYSSVTSVTRAVVAL